MSGRLPVGSRGASQLRNEVGGEQLGGSQLGVPRWLGVVVVAGLVDGSVEVHAVGAWAVPLGR